VRRPLAQRRRLGDPLSKFFADRGPHLAAMIAYFGLLSSVSLIFLALAVLGWTGHAEESSYFVEALQHLFPSQPIDNIVRVVEEIQENATALGVIGAVFLLWTSLSLFSVLESAFNIVYDRPNRSFLHGKSLATLFMAGSIVILAVGLVLGSFGYDLLQRFAGGLIGNGVVAYLLSAALSTFSVFVFLVLAYERLTNAALSLREVWPGAALAAVLLQLTFQVLPLFVRLSSEVAAVQALGASALLLIWIYVMANVIVLGAEVNRWLARRDEDEVAGLA
jgi:YihY family inner membrane protein